MVRTRRRRTTTTISETSPKRSRVANTSDRERRDAALGHDQTGRKRTVSLETFLSLAKALQPVGTEGVDEDSELRIRGIDLHVAENRKNHHTDEYEHQCLIVRRGQPFKVTLSFDRPYDEQRDMVYMQFTTGARPQENKGTLVRVKMQPDGPKSLRCWHVQYVSSEDKSVKVSVTPASDAVIGYHCPYIETVSRDSMGITHQNRRQFTTEDFIVLCNPWCSEDDVYMEDEEEKMEYVMNESGRIWIGTANNHEGLPWDFGQFEDVVLDCVLWIMDKAELAAAARSSPVIITRTVSAWANKMDENGILEGRWDDKWPRGTTEPWAWTGSVPIIEQFMKRKRSVQFGQCWVFSGLVTSLMRAIGIPTRSVTNFESAHDTDASMTIDFHWNESDDPVEDLNDSTWNFHVWNESWFCRPDLPEGYDGWQCHDATPQEASQGVMRCGPVPVKAVRDGDVYLPYDAPFVFAEVNGDKVHWLVKEDGSTEFIGIEKQVIGRYISTKAVGSASRNDITDLYKHKEGSEEERKAVYRAYRYSSRKDRDIYQVAEPDVLFKLSTPKDTQIGEDIIVKVELTSVSSEVRNVSAKLHAVIMFYTGVTSDHICSETIECQLQPNAVAEQTFTVTAEQYGNILRPEAAIQVYLLGKVKDTGRTSAHMEAFSLLKPHITLTVPDKVPLREEFEIIMEFKNPLQETLVGGDFHIEAPGITKSLVISHEGAAEPGEIVRSTTILVPRKAGNKEIIVRFSSPQLTGLTGTADVYIKYSF